MARMGPRKPMKIKLSPAGQDPTPSLGSLVYLESGEVGQITEEGPKHWYIKAKSIAGWVRKEDLLIRLDISTI